MALILPNTDIPLNTREILYTALTRSRSGATLVGSRETFAQGVVRSARRFSGVAERGAPPSPQTGRKSVKWTKEDMRKVVNSGSHRPFARNRANRFQPWISSL